MKLKAKRVKDGFLIPLVEELKDREEVEVEIVQKNEFLEFLKKVYNGRENISRTTDEKALEKALEEKYGL
ncbi:MAG: hypothetical protein ACUVTO_09735 [Candidatus Caldatribacteriaceae bacterium]